MKILIASKNPVKIEGAKEAFLHYFQDVEIEGISVPSDVSDGPVNEEIYEGVKNRINNLAKYAKNNNVEADYFLAIEDGITNLFGEWININMAIVRDKNGYESFGTSPGYPIPKKYVNDIREFTLGVVMDKLFKDEDLARKKGGLSFLTHDVITRRDITRGAFIMALTEHINEEWNDKN